jgi:hypothetical protein
MVFLSTSCVIDVSINETDIIVLSFKEKKLDNNNTDVLLCTTWLVN